MSGRALAPITAARMADLVEPRSACASDSDHRARQIGAAPMAPYSGPSDLAFGGCARPRAIAAEMGPAGHIPVAHEEEDHATSGSAGFLSGVGNFFDSIGEAFASTEPGAVTKPGRSAKVPGGGVAALIPYGALEPSLARELQELLARSEREQREYYWGVFENGEVIQPGEGRQVSAPMLKSGGGNQKWHFHTHPRITTFSNGPSGDVAPVGTKTNQFSPNDWSVYQLLHRMYPDAMGAVIAPDGLLLYLKDKPSEDKPTQSATLHK